MSIGISRSSPGNLYAPNIISMGFNYPGVTRPILVAGRPVRGGGIRGYMPQPIVDVDKNYVDYEQIRFTLREAWNTNYQGELYAKFGTTKSPVTPFRAVTNSGDLLSRKNYTCGGTCQTFQSRPNLHGLKQRFGAIQYQCDETTLPPAACNVKYVYDSSDYTTYLKQRATARNYNDISYGGDDNNASQSPFRHIRRY